MKDLSYVFLLTAANDLSTGQTVCKGSDKDPCKCDLIDGSGMIDITRLGNTDGTPHFTGVPADQSDGSTYSYNPCVGFDQDDYKGLAILQTFPTSQTSNDNTYYDLGVQSSAQFKKSGNKITLTYASADQTYPSNSTVGLVCSKSGSDVFTAQGSSDGTNYGFTLTGPTVCSKKSGGGGGELSGGSILLIICTVLIFVYLVGGIIYNKKKNGAEGSDVIPNKDFWTSLPGLIKDGFMFLVYKCRGKPNGTYQEV